MIIFVCTIVDLICFCGDLQDFIQILEVTKTVYFSFMWSRMMQHVTQACKVDPGDRVTQPNLGNFACKPELS